MDADEGKQDDIGHDGVLQFLVDHGVAAVFDDDGLLIIFLDIGQRLNQHFRPVKIR